MAMHVDLRDLRLFLGVAETGSFSTCARNQGLSQPALSRAIRDLEDRVGARLFDRDTRSVRLTATGAQLRPLAERLLRETHIGLGQLEQFVKGARGRIVVAALPTLAATMLPVAIRRFQQSWPDVDFEVVDTLQDQVIESVANGDADLGLAAQQSANPRLTYQPLVTDPFGLVCRRDDPLVRQANHSWAEFSHRPFIAMNRNSSIRAITDAALLQAMMPIKALFECAHLATVGGLIASGLGISALSRLSMPLLAEDLAWFELSGPRIARSIGVVERVDSLANPMARRFVDCLLEVRKAM